MSLYHMIANRWVKPVIEKHQEEGRQEACREFQEWLNRKKVCPSMNHHRGRKSNPHLEPPLRTCTPKGARVVHVQNTPAQEPKLAVRYC